MAERPDPSREVPEGYELVAAPDPGWRLETGRRCRWTEGRPARSCKKPSVAALNRGRYVGLVRRESWWAYCPAHLYGRWVEGGQVMRWILRKLESA